MPVSTTEWMASLNMAELPVMPEAINLVTAIRPLPARAAKMTLRDPRAEDMVLAPRYCRGRFG